MLIKVTLGNLGTKARAYKVSTGPVVFFGECEACQKAKDNRGTLENAQHSAQAMSTPNAQKLIGVSALNLKQFDTAIEAFEAYLAIAPSAKDKSQIVYQLATAYEGRKDRAKACAYYKQIVSDPQFGAVAKYKVEEELKCNQ